jgi:hypothetical protein
LDAIREEWDDFAFDEFQNLFLAWMKQSQ